ncbi:MAG: ABC transporter substrate binding protein [Desulfobacteraceae bacterium]
MKKNIKMKIWGKIALSLLGVCLFAATGFAGDVAGKKVLFIDSYHLGYDWSDGVVDGVRQVLEQTGAELRIHRMDTKRNQSEGFKRQAALQAKALIETYQPDVVITSDDNASKYLIQPYYRDSDLPIVFCGVNWDATVYGYPYANATGMVEVELIEPLVAQLRQLAKGDKSGFLSIDGTTSIKDNAHHSQILGKPYDKTYYVLTYQDWKECFLQLQNEVDFLVVGNPQGLSGWDENDFVHFAARHTRIPTGATIHWVKKFSLIGYMRVPQEQGLWAAGAALKILRGTPPSAIPMAQNREGNLIINMRLAKRLGVTFDPAVFKRADIINPYPGKKVLYVNSYHAGYSWSDNIEKGIRDVLKNTEVELKLHFMDTKMNRSEAEKKEAALKARKQIDAYAPDVVIASDDNASRYLIMPFYKDADLPFVFCGVNGDSSRYGYPYRNVTGMEEINRQEIAFKLLRPYAKGGRKGVLVANTLTSKYILQHTTEKLGVKFHKVYMADTYAQWKDFYLRLQNEVDMFTIGPHTGVIGWDEKDFTQFAFRNARIPTITGYSDAMPHTMIGYTVLPEEHGAWAAATALRIIDGEDPGDIPIAQNKQGKLFLNLRYVKKLGVVIDRAVYSRAEIIE